MPDGLAASIAIVNRLFHEASLEDFYSTLFYSTFDPKTRILNYVNAGHFPPMVLRRDRSGIEWLGTGGAPVGLFHTNSYEAAAIALHPSDTMVAYTDGVIDSLNASGEEWGIERMVRIANAGEDRTAIELRTSITDAVHAFGNGAEQHDDMTLVILRVL
jgi:sigma-B regulation protein RsbU (phosphoserine phosphatase)